MDSSFGILLVIDDNFVLFPRTRLIESLDFFFTQLNFIILARGTPTDGRTLSIYFFASTIVVFTILRAITTIFIYLNTMHYNMFFFEGFSIDRFGLIDNKVSGILIILSIEAVSASTSRTAVTELFKARAMQP